MCLQALLSVGACTMARRALEPYLANEAELRKLAVFATARAAAIATAASAAAAAADSATAAESAAATASVATADCIDASVAAAIGVATADVGFVGPLELRRTSGDACSGGDVALGCCYLLLLATRYSLMPTHCSLLLGLT